MLSFAVFLTGGCEAADEIHKLLNEPSPSPSATVTSSPGTTAPAPVPAASETPFSVNPLYGFYNEFQSAGQSASLSLIEALSSENTAQSLQLSLALSAHLIALSDIGATICRLFPGDDGAGYSGTVEGAASGSGTMGASENNDYTFTFTYNGGTLLIGEFTGDSAVRFSLGRYEEDASTPEPKPSSPDWSSTPPPPEEPVFDAQRTCSIQETAEGWTSAVEENGTVSSFTISENVIEFIWGGLSARLENGKLALTGAPEAPAQ
jgi:hypothetical protein